MFKKNMNKTTIVLVVLGIFIAYHIYKSVNKEIPDNPPITKIKCNDKYVATSWGDFNWIPDDGGSSYETGGEYTVGLKTPRFDAKPGDTVHINILSNPKVVAVHQILDDKYTHKEYKISKEGKQYILSLPTEKGEYIFKVLADWDVERHNTATIFHVEVK